MSDEMHDWVLDWVLDYYQGASWDGKPPGAEYFGDALIIAYTAYDEVAIAIHSLARLDKAFADYQVLTAREDAGEDVCPADHIQTLIESTLVL